MFGGGAAEADGEGDAEVAAAEPDEPHVSGGAAAAAAGAVVDLDLQGFSGVGMGGAVRGSATGGGAVDPGPAAGVAEYRVGEAKKLLKDQPNIKVEEIAEQVGYNSKSSFNTVFKKLTGSTPSEFRSRKN